MFELISNDNLPPQKFINFYSELYVLIREMNTSIKG